MSKLPNVLKEFLKDSVKNNSRLIGGRYSTKQRQEVYCLYFELEYTSTKIAKVMKVNKHTISDDVSYWYEKLATEWSKVDIHGWHMKQLYSLQSQKHRLEELRKAKTLTNKITIEKLLLQIDDKSIRLLTLENKTEEKTRNNSISILNKFAENNGIEHRFFDQYSLLKVTEDQFNKIQKVLSNES